MRCTTHRNTDLPQLPIEEELAAQKAADEVQAALKAAGGAEAAEKTAEEVEAAQKATGEADATEKAAEEAEAAQKATGEADACNRKCSG